MLIALWVTPARDAVLRGGLAARWCRWEGRSGGGGKRGRRAPFFSPQGRAGPGCAIGRPADPTPPRPKWGWGTSVPGEGPGRCRGAPDRTGSAVPSCPGLPRRRAPKLPGCTTRPVTCPRGANRRSRDVSVQQLRGCGAARGVRAVRHGQAPRGVRAAERRHGRAGHPAETGAAGRGGRAVPAGGGPRLPAVSKLPVRRRGVPAGPAPGGHLWAGGARRGPGFETARQLAPAGRRRGRAAAAAAEEFSAARARALHRGAGEAGAAAAVRACFPR